MTNPLRTLAVVLILALLAVGITQGGHGHGPGGAMPMTMGMGMSEAPTDELGFLQHMIPHHREAVASAQRLLALTKRPELQALLRDIIDSQTTQIELMRGWLAEWYPEADPEAPYQPMMRDLNGAPVAEQERAFLEDMLMHHMMAVRDARLLLAGGLAEHPEVAALANDIVAEQMGEMRLMQRWLATWFAGDAAVHGMGGHGMGGHGMGAMHGPGGAMRGTVRMGGAMNGAGTAAGYPADVVAALARAYLAGQGLEAEIVEVLGPTVTYEVIVRAGDRERVLLIDARTGAVTEVPER